MNTHTPNYGQSVKARLLNLAKQENIRYQQLVTRYLQERLLFRLSLSEYRSHFVLKGGALLYAYDRFTARPTLDIDFFDLYRICSTQSLDETLLQEAIRATFENRDTHYSENHILFSDRFAQDAELNQRWKAFLKKIKFEPIVPFAEVMNRITQWLKPYWESIKD